MADYIVVHSVKVATEFTPETFGRLTTIGPKFRLPGGGSGKKETHQVCQCECGNILTIRTASLRAMTSLSCGCLQKEVTSRMSKIHGKVHTAEYNIWTNIAQRCNNPNTAQYHDYGGRGIRVCDRWREPNGQGFLNFLEDMGERPSKDLTIDRHPDKNGNYEPGNCRWATRIEQAQNKRNNVMLTYNGRTQCLTDWANELGMRASGIYYRLKAGWPIDKALTQKSRRNKKRKYDAR